MNDNNNSKTVLIPVEIKNRELSAKLLLASVLADRGYDVYLGNKIQHTALDKINPDVYFELSGKDHAARLQRLKEHGIKTIVLGTEGAAFHGVEKFSKLLGADTLNHTDCYCAWGTVAKESLKKVAPATRVEITGNPRFDLLQEPHRMFYAPSANELRKEHGKFILFNTNFSIPIGETSPGEKLSKFNDGDPNKDYIRETLKEQTKILGEFIRLIAETAEKFPDTKIIVRPHPSADPSLYESTFYAHDNVEVTRELEARPWIMAAEAVVHNSCTTGITSALLETPTIAYVPDGLETYHNAITGNTLSPPNEVSYKCYTLSEVFTIIDDYLKGRCEFTLSGDRISTVRKHIHNVDYSSAKRIADVVDSLTYNKNKRTPLAINNKLRLRRGLVRALGSKRFEEMYVKRIRGENRDKFPFTSTKEVEAMIEQFDNEIKPTGLQIERLPYVVNGFRLWCDREI